MAKRKKRKKLPARELKRRKALQDKAYRLRKKLEAEAPVKVAAKRARKQDAKAKKKRPTPPPGPHAIKQAAERKTDRERPGARPGEAERIILRRGAAMDARVQGASYRQIAAENKCSVSTAHDDIAAELMAVAGQTRLDAEQLRDMELERCDLVLRGFRKGVINGDPPSGRVFLAAVLARAKILGIMKHILKPEEEIPDSDLSEREVAMRVAALVEFDRTGIPGGSGKPVKIH